MRYETSDDQLRYLLARLSELLHSHPKTVHTAAAPIRVRFFGFRDHTLTLELRVYVRTTAYSEFLAIQEDIMLRLMKLVKQAGTGFALPAQTLYMARDNGLDAAARAAAETHVRKWAAAQDLPFLGMDEAHRERSTGTLIRRRAHPVPNGANLESPSRVSLPRSTAPIASACTRRFRFRV